MAKPKAKPQSIYTLLALEVTDYRATVTAGINYEVRDKCYFDQNPKVYEFNSLLEIESLCYYLMPSMGSIGDAYVNAMAESFFATLERELLKRRSFKTQAEARLVVFEWIEGWYNPHRRHSALGYVPPINYERKLMTTERRVA